jgi:hypothetical protein
MKYFLPLAFLSLFAFTSCDQCSDVACINSGVCIDGVCDCPVGFTGATCEVEDICLSGTLTCENGGECENGACDCGEWYDGTTCDEKVLSRYDGTYSGSYTCNGNYEIGTARFKEISELDADMVITEGSGRIYNAEFDDANSFDIPSQTINEPLGGTVSVSGSGDINSATVNFAVTYNYGSQGSSTVNCIFSGTN